MSINRSHFYLTDGWEWNKEVLWNDNPFKIMSTSEVSLEWFVNKYYQKSVKSLTMAGNVSTAQI